MIALALITAIVVEDGSAVRAAPSDHAPLKYEISAGAWLEVRGRESGYFRVYDHVRERPGFIRSWRVRAHDLESPGLASELAPIVRFLGDSPGSESLLIGHAALHLQVEKDPARQVASHEAIGRAADRLARQASKRSGARDKRLARHVAVAESHGVGFVAMSDGERSRLCYDGDAMRFVLAHGDATSKASAALMLTQRRCVPADTSQAALESWNDWRLDVLDRAEQDELDPTLRTRLQVRRAEALAKRSHAHGRRGEGEAAAEAIREAIALLSTADRRVLLREHRHEHDRASLRVATTRGARGGPEQLTVTRHEDGRSCLQLPSIEGVDELQEHCSYGIPWPGSVRVSADGRTVTAGIQMTESWTELMVFRRREGGWRADPLVPSLEGPGLGYVELAGFAVTANRLLVVREAWQDSALQRSFELVSLDTLEVVSLAPRPGPAFRRWATRDWRTTTLALR